jgi:signal transduction histidine kinase
MNGILGMAELALGTELSVEQREYLELVKASAEALLGVINDLLDFSEIESGKLVLDAREFSLRASLHEAMKTLAVPAYHKGLELIYEVQPDVPDGLIGDMGRLRQIIVHLVGNAIKFTAAGEVVLRIALQQGAHCQPPSPAGDTVNTCALHVSVADTGIGIPPEKQHLLFEAFQQIDSSLNRKHEGTGLGLALTRQLVEMHGGTIGFDSTVGVGTVFTVYLQAQPPTGDPGEEGSASQSNALDSKQEAKSRLAKR